MADQQWLSADQQRTWRAYLLMHTRLVGVLGRHLQASAGLSAADFEVLAHLSDAPGGRLRPFELEESLDWGQSRLSHHLTRMTARALVRRDSCTEDGRGSVIVITETGRQSLSAALPAHLTAVRELFFDALSRDEEATLERLAVQVTARLDTADIGRR